MFTVRLLSFSAGVLTLMAPCLVMAQTSGSQPVGPIQMPPVTVTAQKEPAEAQRLPVSVTTVDDATIDRGGVTAVSDAAMYAPNTFFSELTARKISNATFRGIGSSPANAGVTTFIDGVPQLNTNSSSLGLSDVHQIEFVRGSQSALFGRNTLGGVVNITSLRPRLGNWGGAVRLPFGTENSRGLQGHFSGPIRSDRLGLGVAFDYGQRDGYTTNTITGSDLDRRESFSGKAQLLWTPSAMWETRLIVAGERDRDGDYALSDLAGLRQQPFEVARDFEGRTDRDVMSTTFLVRRQGARVAFSSVTGLVRWRAQDLTDLDYSPAPLIRRDNLEKDLQFTQELRWASAPGAAVRLGDATSLRWQSGLFLFTQNYTQDAVNSYAPFLISPEIPFPLDQHVPQSALDDVGIGVFGQATLGFRDRLDLSFGVRVDHERKEADLNTFFVQLPPVSPPVTAEESFSSVSPQVSVAFHVKPERTVYASVGQGFKAGGFNPSSPAGSEVYGEEHAWHAEGGWKSSWVDGRLVANASVFYIDWQDMQLNVPDPFVPGQFYISNVGSATSRGVEFELIARPHRSLSLFSSLGYTRARFGRGSVSSGADVSHHSLQNTPDYTAVVGVEVSRAHGSNGLWFGRGEAVSYGAFKYDPSNTAGQDAYSLVNFRAGLRGTRLMAEAWVRNAFDTRYVPIALPYVPLAPSGFLGEPGRPRTFGATVGLGF